MSKDFDPLSRDAGRQVADAIVVAVLYVAVAFVAAAAFTGCAPAVDQAQVQANVNVATALATMKNGGVKAPQIIFEDKSELPAQEAEPPAQEPDPEPTAEPTVPPPPLPKPQVVFYRCQTPTCIPLRFEQYYPGETIPPFGVCPTCKRQTTLVPMESSK
jgi:hypothetical protein